MGYPGDEENMYRTFFENSRDAVVLVSREGRFINMNQSYLDMFGYTREELLEQSVSLVYIYPEERIKFYEEIQRKGFVKDYDCRFRRKDGKILDCLSTTAVWKTNSGEIIGSWGIIRDVTEKKKVERKLAGYQSKLRALSFELSRAEESQRRRIARDLHDSIGQTLSLSLTRLIEFRKMLSLPLQVSQLDEIIDIIEKTDQDVQSLIFDISPPILYDLGFSPAVEWLLERFRAKYGLDFQVQDDGCCGGLNLDLRVLLFQSVRELLINVTKHAHTDMVFIKMSYTDGKIEIVVEDRGVGFDGSSPTYKSGGFGLFSIFDRLDSIGGSMRVVSEPGKGTKVILRVPARIRKARERR